MKLSDIEPCVELLARHPEFISIYGSKREPLRAVLKLLVTSLSFLGVVHKAVEANHVEMFGIGAVAFLTDDFASAAKAPQFFWLGPTIIQRLLKGESPILSDKEPSAPVPSMDLRSSLGPLVSETNVCKSPRSSIT